MKDLICLRKHGRGIWKYRKEVQMTKEKFNIITLLEASHVIIYITRIVKCKEILSERTDGKTSRMQCGQREGPYDKEMKSNVS